MATINRAYAESRYGQLHYRIAAPASATNAPPLLCLHQTPSHSGDWAPVMPTLGEKRVVIAVDTPGYGMSDMPPAPINIEDFGDIMAQFMADLAAKGIVPKGPFDVMGFHTGSLIGTELARSRPDKVRRAVLFGLAAYSAEVREAKLAGLFQNFPPPGDNLDHIEKLWAIVQKLSDPRMSPEEKHVSMAECLRLGTRMPWGYVGVYRYDFLGAMAQVHQPVLIMNPDDDLCAVTKATSHLFPNGTRYDLPGVKHGVLSIEHDRVVDRIEAFLAD